MSRARVLEHHDELGLPWDEWADRRVHRLVKGRDFLRSSEAVVEAAQNAARRMANESFLSELAGLKHAYFASSETNFTGCKSSRLPYQPCTAGSQSSREG